VVEGLRGISFVHIEALLELVRSGHAGDRIDLPGDVRAIKGYSTITITSGRPAPVGTYMMKGPGDLVIKEASMVLSCAIIDLSGNSPFEKDKGLGYCDGRKAALFDTAKLHFPLLVRPRKPGDYFYPSGFGKRKKLQDYFVDEKVPRDQRDSIPLLLGDTGLAWIIGYRADERFMIDKNTVKALKFKMCPLIT